MSETDWEYRTDGDAAPAAVRWLDYTGALINFASGWTFGLQLVNYDNVAVKEITEQDAFTGAATSPNVIVDWPSDFFSDVPPGRYMVHLKAIEQASTKARFFKLDNLPTLEVIQAPTGV